MIIKIDMDGVIRDIVPTMVKIYNNEFKQNMSVDEVTEYNVNSCFMDIISKTGKLATDYFFIDNAEEIFTKSKLCNGAKEAIDMLHRAGHKIIICTWQQTHESKIYTLNYLNDNNIYYDDICFTKEKELVKSDVMIDDNSDFLKSDPSEKKICIDAPYNREYKDCERYNSLYDFVVKFLGL